MSACAKAAWRDREAVPTRQLSACAQRGTELALRLQRYAPTSHPVLRGGYAGTGGYGAGSEMGYGATRGRGSAASKTRLQGCAAVYGGSAAVYGGSAAVYGGSTAVYGGSAAVYGDSAA
eukprot:2694553-Rhodomonas_salina.1